MKMSSGEDKKKVKKKKSPIECDASPAYRRGLSTSSWSQTVASKGLTF